MRGALHILGTVVLLPYIALASGFVLLDRAISAGSLLSLFEFLLAVAVWMIPWGLIGFACLIVVVAGLGITTRWRWLGGLCLSLLAASSVAIIVVVSTSPIGVEELLFLFPCVVVMVWGAWLAVVER